MTEGRDFEQDLRREWKIIMMVEATEIGRLYLRNIEDIAVERLYASKEGDEEWSFLFRTPGSFDIYYIPHEEIESWGFDPDWGELEGLHWKEERWRQLLEEEQEPTIEELTEWRRAVAYLKSENGDCSLAWIVPITITSFEPSWLGEIIGGWALFDCGAVEGVDQDPCLEGVYKTPGDAVTGLLSKLGVGHVPSMLASSTG